MNAPHQFTCLVVDDDADFFAILAKVVRQEGGQISHCLDLKSARAMIEQCTFDLVILDNRLPDGTGYSFYAHLSRRCPESVVVMVTGVPELSQAVELTRNGLFDYLTKPLNLEDFTLCLRRVQQRLNYSDPAGTGDLIGDSPVLLEALNALHQAARHPQASVLLTGETGTGKDLAARLLHRNTFAATSAYVPLNCSAVPAEMFEAELFGSEKGAFTGADKRRDGLVAAAANGTLFLDEIAEIPLPPQSKLLRFLEAREYRPLGSNALHQFTGRIVAATNRSLADEVKRGRFREDLMFRLAVVTVRLPALREHLSDLPALVESLLAQLCGKYQRQRLSLKPGDLDMLRAYSFPGNVRELRNLLERALLRTSDGTPWLAFDRAWLSTPASCATLAPACGLPPLRPADRQLNVFEHQEYCLIQQALEAEGGGIRRAATRLGITHQSLLRRLEKWPELRQVTPSN